MKDNRAPTVDNIKPSFIFHAQDLSGDVLVSTGDLKDWLHVEVNRLAS